MHTSKFNLTAEAVLQRLVAQDYEGLLQIAPHSRITAAHLKDAVADYPYHPIIPPVPIGNLLDIIEVRDSQPISWSVNLQLWTEEEGKSDLTLEMHFRESSSDIYTVEIDDLHVL